MLKEFGGGSSAADVNTETDGQESLQLLAQLLGLLQAGGAVGSDEVQGLERFLVEIRGLGLDHLNGHDAQGPDVDLRAVLLLLDDFGSHPVRSANHRSTLRLGLSELSTEAKIG